ncbi:unnamed protein product, partial [Medioppia subpectinata]
SEFTSRRNNSSISCDNVSINTINDKTFHKRVENIRYNSSKVSVKNLTPTKMFKRMMKGNAKTWTPNKNSAYDSNRSLIVLTEEEAMDMQNNHKKQIIAIRNELQFRLDESEALLESVVKENKTKDKKIAEQMALLQEVNDLIVLIENTAEKKRVMSEGNERLLKENQQYERKAQFLENEVKKLNELLAANRTPVATAAPIFSIPTSVITHTNQLNN